VSDDRLVPAPTPDTPDGSPASGAVTTTERPEAGAAAAPPREPEARLEPGTEPEVVPFDEADTVELAVDELRAAAAAAGAAVLDTQPPEGAVPDELAVAADDAPLHPMDPRMRERRVAVTRAEGRRRLRILLGVVAVASALGMAWLVVQSPLLAVDTVDVQGTRRETPETVRAAAGVDEGEPLLFVDAGAVVGRVERLPWVAQAKVGRDFPNDVRITIVERLPVAWVRRPSAPGAPRGSGAVALIDPSGRVLGDEAAPPAGMPELAGAVRVGAPGTHIRPRGLAPVVAQLPEGLRAQVGAVIAEDGRAVLVLVTPPGGAAPAAEEVRLGALTEIRAKGAAALAVLDQLASEEARVSYVDVRVPGAPATR
jgi:cell division protein FtsQ